MENQEEDLELLLSMHNHEENDDQLRVPETPPFSPSSGYASDEEFPKNKKPLGMDAFKDLVKDDLDEAKADKESTSSLDFNRNKERSAMLSASDVETETFSQLRIRNRLVSAKCIDERFSSLRFIHLRTIRHAVSFEVIRGNWATVGVLIEKGITKLSSCGKNYAVWKLGTLDNNVISLFLFGDAYTSHWKESPGSILSIFNAKVRRDEKANDCSLSVFAVDQLVKLGTSADYGTCKGKRKDGTPCTSAINKSQGMYCQFHSNATKQKYITQRTELSGGNLRSAFREPSKQGIHVVKPLSEKAKTHKRPVTIMSADDLKKALRKANKVTPKQQSQGIRFLAKVANAENIDPNANIGKSEELKQYEDYLKKRPHSVATRTGSKLYPERETKKNKSCQNASDLIELDLDD